MDRSFMPKIQSPLAVPTRAAPWVDASPPNEDGEVGVDKGSPRPSDLAPSPFFWSRPLSFMCSSSPPRLDAGEASLPSCADYLRLWCFAGHWAEVNRTVLHKAQESQGHIHGSIAFRVVLFLVLIGWPVFGMMADSFGFALLFRSPPCLPPVHDIACNLGCCQVNLGW
ncbi:hypothetical protein VPH35_073529 [Triticum aestivum]|uniref:Uncharacterized protein n=1 Tax=Triticum turgidum subsp. durum TaxID=4567 RepID=A0A9R0WDW5_TRITD|nr:uncharacterized protein LOC123092542 isoform X3 [Triticum aestivum]VAI06936.1 unnamed protein product [Triticum turgidum subsp. durum]